MQTPEIQIGDAALAAARQQEYRTIRGYGHVNGGPVTHEGGLTLSVPSDTRMWIDGTAVDVDPNNNTVQLVSHDRWPRWVSIVVNDDGTVEAVHGQVNEPLSVGSGTAEEDVTGREAPRPQPPVIHDATQALHSFVWVDANASTIPEEHVVDRRIDARLQAYNFDTSESPDRTLDTLDVDYVNPNANSSVDVSSGASFGGDVDVAGDVSHDTENGAVAWVAASEGAAAVEAACQDHGRVYVYGGGTWSETLEVPTYTHVEHVGDGYIYVADDHNLTEYDGYHGGKVQCLITTDGHDGSEVHEVTVEGFNVFWEPENKTGQTDFYYTGFWVYNAENTTFKNCRAVDVMPEWNDSSPDPPQRAYGFLVTDCRRYDGSVELKKCRAYNCGYEGFGVRGFNRGVVLDQCAALNNGTHSIQVSGWTGGRNTSYRGRPERVVVRDSYGGSSIIHHGVDEPHSENAGDYENDYHQPGDHNITFERCYSGSNFVVMQSGYGTTFRDCTGEVTIRVRNAERVENVLIEGHNYQPTGHNSRDYPVQLWIQGNDAQIRGVTVRDYVGEVTSLIGWDDEDDAGYTNIEIDNIRVEDSVIKDGVNDPNVDTNNSVFQARDHNNEFIVTNVSLDNCFVGTPYIYEEWGSNTSQEVHNLRITNCDLRAITAVEPESEDNADVVEYSGNVPEVRPKRGLYFRDTDSWTLSSGSEQQINWNGTVDSPSTLGTLDSNGGWIAPDSGLYQVRFQVSILPVETSGGQLKARIDGDTIVNRERYENVSAGNNATVTMETTIDVNKGDTVNTYFQQNTGESQSISTALTRTVFEVVKLR